jgi:hypothetical protein
MENMLRNTLGTHWELKGNITWKNEKKSSSTPPPPQKEFYLNRRSSTQFEEGLITL